MRPNAPNSGGGGGAMSPEWNDKLGTLSVDGVVILSLDKPAENMRAILNAFQRVSWAHWIPIPLKPEFLKEGLGEAVYKLNGGRKKQKTPLVHFRRDGQGKGVIWEWRKEQ